MEPFIQRMLERAKARREKLDEQLSNAGHDIKKRRSPLKDANALLEQATAISKSPAKSPVKITNNTLPAKSPHKSPIPQSIISKNNEPANKENGDLGTCMVRSKLQRLGKLYSDDSCLGLSSPIHRTEEKFSAEENIEPKPARKGARLDRFAALASTISNWEDDLSHPTITNLKTKPTDSKAEKIQPKFNEQVKSASESQPSTSRDKWIIINSEKSKNSSPVKLKWDKTVLENLQMEEKKQISPNKSNGSLKSKKMEADCDLSGSPANSSRSNDSKVSNTSEKVVKNANTTSTSRLLPRTGFNGSPKTLVQPSGSVLSKASIFEAKNVDTKAKDPAQMSLAERMAFFERNKGEAPLIPKAPLTMSIPPKKLQEKDKSQSGSNIDLSPINILSKTVLEQRAIFEQSSNKKVEEMENHILQATYAERQRELGMLRSRFNANKEIARAAAGSCVRTSESSEGGGKSCSPKSSLVCPVKPTPAPDHTAQPPPPPPLPQPEIISYHSKSSPIKRQVIGSPPKVYNSNAISEVKRIRVCLPKPGTLYPNLSEIEVTESETDSEYTVDSSEPVTATLDETETETATEDDYYVQDETDQGTESDRESTQNTSFGRTSFGRSILHAFNERSLFNKKRSIEPDPDSTTTDISVLDEMDQYLDECLDIDLSHDVKEGPTPPKMNRNGGKLSTACSSTKYRSPLKAVSPISTPKKTNFYLEDGNKCVPLVRTVSAYRRQQSELSKTPSRSATKSANSNLTSADKHEDESRLVENKVKKLVDEIEQQQKKIEEASKALNLCYSSVEFNDSSEHVGAEWALLIATQKRQTAVNELQRLKREGTLRPVRAGLSEMQGSGSLIISAITLPLKQEYSRNMGNTYLHCVCLMSHLGEVVGTQAATAEPGDSCLRFTSMLKLDDLHSDFRINVEVYSFQTQPKYLPHEKKYHINHNVKTVNKTPKKKNQFVTPYIESPAGPTAIRSPAFQLIGTTTITLNDVNQEQFTLHKDSPYCPLEGYLRMRISRKLSVLVEHRGFLTIHEDISNLGAWRRRWCWLKDAKLHYWLNPDDEHKKDPIGCLDLEDVFTKNIQFVNREKCARPFTFLLEISRSAQPEDTDSLIMKTNGIETKIEYFLLADTKEEGLQWISKLNKTLSLIRVWGSFRDTV